MRTSRGRLLDTVAFVAAVGWAVFVAVDQSGAAVRLPAWFFGLDQFLAVLGCLALWWRRRYPVQIAVGLVVVGSVSDLVALAMLVGLFTVANRAATRTVLAVFGASIASAGIFVLVRPVEERFTTFVLGVLLQGVAVGWGLFWHQRRQRRLEAARDREDRVRAEVRRELAQEIHDVLGHRLSLLSLHAGALQFHRTAPAQDVDLAVETIRSTAHRAMQDLRDVVGVMRNPLGDEPAVGDLRARLEELATEMRSTGTRVDAGWGPFDGGVGVDVPAAVGQTVFRVVREGLTNARKHAPGQAVSVQVREESAGVEVLLENGLVPTARTPGGGFGVRGLTERLLLVGGTLEAGPVGAAGWRLRAWIPWSR